MKSNHFLLKTLSTFLALCLALPSSVWALRFEAKQEQESGLEELTVALAGQPNAPRETLSPASRQWVPRTGLEETQLGRRRFAGTLTGFLLGAAAGPLLSSAVTSQIPRIDTTLATVGPASQELPTGEGVVSVQFGVPTPQASTPGPPGASSEQANLVVAPGSRYARYYVPVQGPDGTALETGNHDNLVFFWDERGRDFQNVQRFQIRVDTAEALSASNPGILDVTPALQQTGSTGFLEVSLQGMQTRNVRLVSHGDQTFGAIRGFYVQVWTANPNAETRLSFGSIAYRSGDFDDFLSDDALHRQLQTEQEGRRGAFWASITTGGLILGALGHYIDRHRDRRNPSGGRSSSRSLVGLEDLQQVVEEPARQFQLKTKGMTVFREGILARPAAFDLSRSRRLIIQGGLEEPQGMPKAVPVLWIDEATVAGMLDFVRQMGVVATDSFLFNGQRFNRTQAMAVLPTTHPMPPSAILEPGLNPTAQEVAVILHISLQTGMVFVANLQRFTAADGQAYLFIQIQA